MKIRLQIGVTAVFALVSVALIGSIVSYLYFDQRNLALDTARKDMLEARDRSVSSILGTINEAASVVGVAASMVGDFPSEARSLSMLDVMSSLVEEDEHFYGIYFGFQEDGAFYQNIQLPKGLEAFGPTSLPPPEGATRVLRAIDLSDGVVLERYHWANSNDRHVEFLQGPPEFDPRSRPWYQGAVANPGVFVSPAYRFESTGRLGITFSRKIMDKTGSLIGVAGADITMSELGRIIEDIRVGDGGYAFMTGRASQFIAVTGSRNEGRKTRFLPISKGAFPELDNEAVEIALKRWRADSQSYFRFSIGEDKEPYIASVAPVPVVHGLELVLGFVVPEDEFVGALKASTLHVIQLSAVALVFAVLLMGVIAHFLSRNLQRVTAEAKRIRNFDLSSNVLLQSRIVEVSDLNDAMRSMKTGLASFGAYVPKSLVRSIVARGERVEIGGKSRPVTILFSDIEGFTSKTEGVVPSDLMPALSEYFSQQEHHITSHNGIVDKYIGDAVMALWNAPDRDDDHCENACRAVLACMRAEDEFNASGHSSPLHPVRTRFGLHCDTVVVGNVGSMNRMQYTALGAAVNLASRVEALCKVYGTRALVTETVLRQTGDIFITREIDVVAPAGTIKPTRIFELLGEKGDNCNFPCSPEVKRDVEEWKVCYGLYCSQKWAEAYAAFIRYAERSSNEKLVEIYRQRCREFMTAPPDAGWDGVSRFFSKS